MSGETIEIIESFDTVCFLFSRPWCNISSRVAKLYEQLATAVVFFMLAGVFRYSVTGCIMKGRMLECGCVFIET